MFGDLTKLLPYASRFIGFFIVSPLFFYWKIPWAAKFSLVLGCTLFFSMNGPGLALDQTLFLNSLVQLTAGYLIGFLFSLIFEGALLAGQLIGTLSGFSALELLDPREILNEPLIGRVFSLLVAVLFFSLDLHHFLLRFLLTHFAIPENTDFLQTIAEFTGQLFEYALYYATLPLTLLLSLNLFLLVISRSFPSIPLFWIAFPGQLMVGICALAVSIDYFPEVVQKVLFELKIFIVESVKNFTF
jgi:flagellar biosynthesis protein FliR